MPTTTASKAGLRANANAKREKAAQKTPLPSRQQARAELLESRKVAPAQEILDKVTRPIKGTPRKPTTPATTTATENPREEFDRLNALPLSKQTKAIQARIRVLGNLPENCGPRPDQAATIPATRGTKKPERKLAEEAQVVPEQPVPAQACKADRYVEEFTRLGWEPSLTRLDGLVELVARRGNEAIYLAWLREAHVSGTSTYTFADRTVKVRNPAEAMRIAARQPEEAAANQAKVASNVQFRRKATGPTIKTVPFDPTTATDEEIVDALEARRISWHNQYRVESETATVGKRKGITITIRETPDASYKVVSFIDPEYGFKAFRLDHLENVGRKVDLERIKQQIIASLAKDANKKTKAS